MKLGAEHAILASLRAPGSETQLTQTLARVCQADPRFAASFVERVLRGSRRPHDPRWDELPSELECRAEVVVPSGRFDLEFTDARTGWRVLVELKIAAGYGYRQIERYLGELDPADTRQVLVSITRDKPVYGDPPVDETNPNWAGSLAWASVTDSLRELRPSDPRLASQWPLFLDVLEYEGSMGVTNVEPELLQAWSKAVPARAHAVAFVESLRHPLLEALRDVLSTRNPDRPREQLADVTPAPSAGRRPQVDVQFMVPAGGDVHVAAQLWAWEDFRFAVSARYPRDDRTEAARNAIAQLAVAGFGNWRNRWLWASLPLDDDLLYDPDLIDRLIGWAAERFDDVARSGVLDLGVDGSAIALDEQEAAEI